MPSPFPGMDPFIESQRWQGFHSRFVTALGDALVRQVRPRYVVDVEDFVYVADAHKEDHELIAPDVSVAQEDDWSRQSSENVSVGVAMSPAVLTLPTPKRHRQHYLTIQTRDTHQVITVIELLSPWNKSKSGGRKDYLSKRQNVLATMSHLVELDLLRGGVRLPTVEPLPAGDYYAFVCRIQQRPKADVYSWTVRDPLPEVPVPLAEGDADAVVDLQSIFEQTYDRAGYDYALKYDRAVDPPFNDNDSDWVRELLGARDKQENS